jgi:dihydrofolate reductase
MPQPSPTLGLIVAMDPRGLIGLNGTIPWKKPADMRRFKAKTMGSNLVMGRATWDSIGRPLPGRTIYVVSRTPEAVKGQGETVIACGSLEEAMEKNAATGKTLIVAGGADIYRLAIERKYVAWIDLTVVHEVTQTSPTDKTVYFGSELFNGYELLDSFQHESTEKNAEDESLTHSLYKVKP